MCSYSSSASAEENWVPKQLSFCHLWLLNKKLTLTLFVSIACTTSPWNRQHLKSKAFHSHFELDREIDFPKHQLVSFNFYLFDWTMAIINHTCLLLQCGTPQESMWGLPAFKTDIVQEQNIEHPCWVKLGPVRSAVPVLLSGWLFCFHYKENPVSSKTHKV